MMKLNKVNVVLFCSFVALLIILPWLPISNDISAKNKPWMLSSSVPEDSLSLYYKENFEVLKENSVLKVMKDSLKKSALILVDAWGVPVEDSLLIKDFSLFDEKSSVFKIHKRLANRNVHAERTELKDALTSGMFLFGGDSLEYGRKTYIPTLGYSESIYCQNCGDSVMIAKLDSVLTAGAFEKYAWTTQTSRDGNRENLHKTLKMIADLAKNHPEVKFIIQGTHRPILGTPETRRMYHPHWVPVVVVN